MVKETNFWINIITNSKKAKLFFATLSCIITVVWFGAMLYRDSEDVRQKQVQSIRKIEDLSDEVQYLREEIIAIKKDTGYILGRVKEWENRK